MRTALIIAQMCVAVAIGVAVLWSHRPLGLSGNGDSGSSAPVGQETGAIGVALLTELQNTGSPLAQFYLGAQIQDGVATVNFRHGAEPYLSAVPGMQSEYTRPIAESLQKIPGLTKVQWAINGKIVTDFDA